MWDYDDHLEGMDKRFLAYNGAIDTDQLDWLDHELALADRNGQKVIICGKLINITKFLVKYWCKFNEQKCQVKIQIFCSRFAVPET